MVAISSSLSFDALAGIGMGSLASPRY